MKAKITTNLEDLRKHSEVIPLLNEQGAIDDEAKAEVAEIVAQLKETLAADSKRVALAAPQIGIYKRIICLKFNDSIETYIDPVITKKSPYNETFVSLEPKAWGRGQVYVRRPKEISVVYFTDELKQEHNKLLDAAAAAFISAYNLLDGIVAGDLTTNILSMEKITVDTIPALVEATYSASGLPVVATDGEPSVEEVAGALEQLATGLYKGKLDEILTSKSEEDKELVATARQFWFEERVMLGLTEVVDKDGWEREKAMKYQQKAMEKAQKKHNFKAFAAKRHK